MPNVTWIACHSRTPLDAARIERWGAAAQAALPLLIGGTTRSAIVLDHIALIVWVDAVIAPTTWRQIDEADGALAVTDGFPIGYDSLGLVEPSPVAIADALQSDASAIERFLPPFANVVIDSSGLRLAIDALGFAKVYRAGTSDTVVWSNSATLASLFAYGRLEVSVDGWASQLSHDRFFDDLTALAGVGLEAPRSRVDASDAADTPRLVHAEFLKPVFASVPSGDGVANRVKAILIEFHRSLGALGDATVRIPLSGGRDSRVLAATALRYGRVDEFFTSVPPELDVEIAGRLIDRLDRPVPWVRHDKSAETRSRDELDRVSGITTADIWERLRDYQEGTEGDGEVTPHRIPPGKATFGTVALWGLGGEFGRAFYYDEVATTMPQERANQFWDSTRGGSPLVDRAAREHALGSRVDALRAVLDDRGIHDLKQLDYFYIFQRMRRVKNRVGNTSGMRPYFSPAYLRATLGQTPLERVKTRYYQEIVARSMPAWADTPFSHELKKANPETSTALSLAEAFWQSPRVRQLADEMMDLVQVQHLVVRAKAEDILRPRSGDRLTVDRMRTFNRLLNYFSYRTYVEDVGRRFAEIRGSSAVPFDGLIPVLVAPRRPRGRGAYEASLGRTVRGIRRIVRGGRRRLPRLRP